MLKIKLMRAHKRKSQPETCLSSTNIRPVVNSDNDSDNVTERKEARDKRHKGWAKGGGRDIMKGFISHFYVTYFRTYYSLTLINIIKVTVDIWLLLNIKCKGTLKPGRGSQCFHFSLSHNPHFIHLEPHIYTSWDIFTDDIDILNKATAILSTYYFIICVKL